MTLALSKNPILSRPPGTPTPLRIAPNPLLQPVRPTVASIEADLRHKPHLLADHRYVIRGGRHIFRDARNSKTAAEAVVEIPAADTHFYMLISGRYALWDFVGAVLQLSGQAIAALMITTLSFSKRNIVALCDLIDAGKVGTCHFMCSDYFRGTSTGEFDFAREELGKRPRTVFTSLRNHSKTLLMELADGRKVTILSSANLRSSKNIENASIHGDPGLYSSFRGALIELFAQAAAEEAAR